MVALGQSQGCGRLSIHRYAASLDWGSHSRSRSQRILQVAGRPPLSGAANGEIHRHPGTGIARNEVADGGLLSYGQKIKTVENVGT